MIEPNYNNLDSSWMIDFKDVLDGYNVEGLLPELLLEPEEDEDEEEESDKHPLNELIKDIH